MTEKIRETILDALEETLSAQLRAIRRLRKGDKPEEGPPTEKRKSQIDMAYDILAKSGEPLHINDVLKRIYATFQVHVDRESLVSSLTKKVRKGDRFVRTAKNTFGLRGTSS